MADDLRYSLEDKEEILDSKKRKYDIIIGNPPYGRTTTQRDEKSKNSEFFYIEADKLKHLQNNIIPFAYPENNFNAKGELIEFTWENKQLKGSVPSFEKNRGKIQDMFGFFFGISDHLIKKDGIVCYIVSNTILGVPSYKWFRKYLLENYKFHYIINFNRIQEDGNSMFAPEAKVATCIIIMQKEKPDNHFEVNYLDLGGIESTIEKFNSIANCRWSENPKNKNDIVDFEVKNLKDLNFKKVKQTDFLKNPDYELLIFEKIINKMVRNSKILSSYGHYKCGVSSSKDDVFFAPSKEDLINNVSTFLKEKQINYEVTESNIKELIKHEEIDKFVLNNIYYVYYDIELEKILRKSILKNMRLGNSDSMLSNYKLLIGAHFFYVDDSSRVMNLNCINRKNLYYLTNNDIDVLYYICAIMNSKLSKYYRRITQIDNYEIFPIKDYNLTNITIKNKLIKLSKEIHLFKKDQQSFNKNISDFKSEWFIKNILPKGKNVSVLDGSEFWHLSFTNEMVPDYYVSGAKINEKKENEIILNSESKIVCKDKDIAMQLFENYLKDYDGDLSDKEIVINITAFRDPKEYNKIKQTVETKCNSIEEEIDDLVFTIYEIDDKERIAISNEINET